MLMKILSICSILFIFYSFPTQVNASTELFKIISISHLTKQHSVSIKLNNHIAILPLKNNEDYPSGLQMRLFYHLNSHGEPIIDSYIGLKHLQYKT